MGPNSQPSSIRHVKSPFRKVIALGFYDGPTEGFLEHHEWLQACAFRTLDWDRDSDRRVFEIVRVEHLSFDDVVEELYRDRLPTWPVWVLPSSSHKRAQRILDDCFRRSRPVATITTFDLLSDIAFWTPAEDAPLSSGIPVVPHPKVV